MEPDIIATPLQPEVRPTLVIASKSAASAPHVTPVESDPNFCGGGNKQVRFTAAAAAAVEALQLETTASGSGSSATSNKPGCVSKRGRFVSPGRRTNGTFHPTSSSSSSSTLTSALEYKTYRSPSSTVVGGVPSLCSIPSSQNDDDDDEHQDDDDDSRKQPATNGVDDFMVRAHRPFPTIQIWRLFHAISLTPLSSFVLREQTPASPQPQQSQQHQDSSFIDLPGKSPTGLFLLSSPSAERYANMATPTDFTTDYKHGNNNNPVSFDTSNVLAWLQSPTTNGLFSPSGFSSMLNTPNAAKQQQQQTPTVISTSFFFSDVASLPKQPAIPSDGNSSGGNSNNNIICISPLASNKKQQHHQTPVDLKEIFASPAERSYLRTRTSSDKQDGDAPSLDAVVLAERDVMEDEDLSVLLQLASNTTPRNHGVVFRTSDKQEEQSDSDNLALQLPKFDGKGSGGPKARLTQKSSSKNHDFCPPQLGMRSTGSSAKVAAKEIYVGAAGKGKDGNGKTASGSYPLLYPTDHGASAYLYPHVQPPPGMPTGSMRITVGGQPPPKGSTSPQRPYPDMYSYPPPPHMYPPYMYPPYSSYPPPPPTRQQHLPMYGAAQQPEAKTKSDKSSSKAKAGTPTGDVGSKRSSPLDQPEKSKKKKTTPGSTGTAGQTKRKNKSPQLTDRVERQKAADTIQSLNAASGGKNDKAAALAAAILRGVTMRPSGKWQAQLYFCGKSRYIGVFDTREKAALAYEIAREKLKSDHVPGQDGTTTENLVNLARKAAFDGVNERLSK